MDGVEVRAAGPAKRTAVDPLHNLRALRFYQRRGMRLVAVDRGAVDRARRLNPQIPLVGEHGIPLHDELVLELLTGAEG
ncbi:hypothetical protein ACFY1S_04950 [Micromonospora sp. NPDC000663]|uniref:hypothetical protein n=1 Tax=Micromonospora sp. NPDC000663 TaxID=3364218 RepID=UPI00368147E2